MTTEETRQSGIPAVVPDWLGRLPGGIGRLAAGTADRLRDTRFVGLVAEVAFFVLAGLIPLGVAILALLGGLEPLLGPETFQRVELTLRLGLITSLDGTVEERAVRALGDLLEAGLSSAAVPFLVTVVLSSRGFTGAMRGLGHLYGQEERRAVWRDALATAGFTAGAAFLGLIAVVGAMLGPVSGGTVARVATWARWIVIPLLTVAYLTSLYWYTRGRHARWLEELPGALLTTGVMIGAGIAYGVYLRTAPSLGLGPVVGPIVGSVLASLSLLFTFAASVLIGGALNAERAGDRAPTG